MKVILFLILLSTTAHAKCELKLIPNGVWFNGCPDGSLAEAIDVRTQYNTPFTLVWVKCVKPTLQCGNLKK